MRRLILLAILWAGGSVLPGQLPASVQAPAFEPADETRSAAVEAITSPITVDGALDEPEWRRVEAIGPLTQREPREGEPPTEDTEIFLLRDADHLYIGVRAYDSEPDRIVSTVMTRDGSLDDEDRIEILLDTYGDGRHAFYFATNPAGAMVDGLVSGDGQLDTNWDAVWEVRTRRTDEGWSAEFAIPFRSLSFPSQRSEWGFNVSRTIQRKLEEARWSGARLQTQFLQVSEAGRITNMGDLSQGMGLAVRPFAGGHWDHGPAEESSLSGKPGLDLLYNLTPSLKLTTTLNTDFGETEVDDRQINLARHSLLFPEKRSFFLEDSWVFNFSNTYFGAPGWQAPARAEVIPYFSRTIGLLDGEEVPIDYGLKLTGRHERTEIGFLNVRTRATSDLAADHFSVGRVRQNFFRQSHVGGVFTHGNPGLPSSSGTVGADVRLATSNLLGRSRNLVFNAYGLSSLNEGEAGAGFSYGASLEYPNDVVRWEVMWRDIQEEFRPALGFVSRRNVRLWRVGAMYSPRPEDFLDIQQMFHGIFYNHFTRLDVGETESWRLLFVMPIDWHFHSGDMLHSLFSPDVRYERLFSPFEISPGVSLPVGEYRFTRWRVVAQSAAKRRIVGRQLWSFGPFWSGTAHEVETSVTFKLPPRFTLVSSVNQTFARLQEGDFTARIFSSRIDYTASPFLALSNLVQYDNRSESLGWQSRIRWTIQPGNDLFLVFNRGWIREQGEGWREAFTTRDSRLSAKLQYTLQL